MDGHQKTNAMLIRWGDGDEDARDKVIARLYPQLAEIAAARLRGERNASLSTGDLINDAVLRLIHIDNGFPNHRAHFIALASRIMRQILVDHARAKGASKRRHQKVELQTHVDGNQRFDLIELETALIRLRGLDPQLSELIEMRYFGGMTTADIAVVMEVSEPTVKRRWRVARAWLADAITHPVGNE